MMYRDPYADDRPKEQKILTAFLAVLGLLVMAIPLWLVGKYMWVATQGAVNTAAWPTAGGAIARATLPLVGMAACLALIFKAYLLISNASRNKPRQGDGEMTIREGEARPWKRRFGDEEDW